MFKRVQFIALAGMMAGISILVACGDGGSGISMYVTAKSGLLVRADSNTNASKLGLVPLGKKVEVLEQSDKTMTIDGKTGHWTRIRYNEIEGWSFGGFLSATPPGPGKAAASTCDKLKACYNSAACRQAYTDASAGPAYEFCVIECAGLIKNLDELGESSLDDLSVRTEKCGIKPAY